MLQCVDVDGYRTVNTRVVSSCPKQAKLRINQYSVIWSFRLHSLGPLFGPTEDSSQTTPELLGFRNLANSHQANLPSTSVTPLIAARSESSVKMFKR